MQLLPGEQNSITRLEIDGHWSTQPRSSSDMVIRVDDNRLVVSFGKERHPITRDHPPQGNPEIEPIGGAIEPAIAMGSMRGYLPLATALAELLQDLPPARTGFAVIGHVEPDVWSTLNIDRSPTPQDSPGEQRTYPQASPVHGLIDVLCDLKNFIRTCMFMQAFDPCFQDCPGPTLPKNAFNGMPSDLAHFIFDTKHFQASTHNENISLVQARGDFSRADGIAGF